MINVTKCRQLILFADRSGNDCFEISFAAEKTKVFFLNNNCRQLSLDTDQDRINVGHNQDQNCLKL